MCYVCKKEFNVKKIEAHVELCKLLTKRDMLPTLSQQIPEEPVEFQQVLSIAFKKKSHASPVDSDGDRRKSPSTQRASVGSIKVFDKNE